jgi:hypothetical protein
LKNLVAGPQSGFAEFGKTPIKPLFTNDFSMKNHHLPDAGKKRRQASFRAALPIVNWTV